MSMIILLCVNIVNYRRYAEDLNSSITLNVNTVKHAYYRNITNINHINKSKNVYINTK